MSSVTLPIAHYPAPQGPPRLFAMVSTKKSRSYTPHALRSFFETTPLRSQDRLFIINNDDPEFEEIVAPYRTLLHIITHSSPQSFARNANTMITEALKTSSDLFFMNNDIIFTDNWLNALTEHPTTILSPISNREVQYVGVVAVVKTNHATNQAMTNAPMELAEYLASPRMFQAIAEAHTKEAAGLLRQIVLPFFCVRLPLAVMQRVGKFDESFGRAGGEDYDYCFRAWLAGFNVHMALQSYLIHFWGKSTWTAPTEKSSTTDYSTSFLDIFREKWGDTLFQFVLQEKLSAVTENPEANALLTAGDLGGLIRLLMPKPVEIYLA